MSHSELIRQCLEATGGRYSDTDILLFQQAITSASVSKHDVLLQQGAVCQSLFFNVSASFYQYNHKQDIELNIIDLHPAGEWFLNHNSFTAQKPSDTCIQAYSSGTVFELPVRSLHNLIGQSSSFFGIGRVLNTAASRLFLFDNNLTPEEKYLYVLNHRPALLQQFPQRLLASYLKITPETLSRVRARLAKS